MRLAVVPILILLVATQAFSKWVMVLEFNLNRDYIAKNLCVNRAWPKLKCGGKCQLMKKMAEEEKESSSQSPLAKAKFEEAPFTPPVQAPAIAALPQGHPGQNGYNESFHLFTPPCSVFRPPLS